MNQILCRCRRLFSLRCFRANRTFRSLPFYSFAFRSLACRRLLIADDFFGVDTVRQYVVVGRYVIEPRVIRTQQVNLSLI